MRKYLIIFIIVIGVILAYRLTSKATPSPESQPTQTDKVNLPQDWQAVNPTTGIYRQYEKNIATGYKPIITIVRSTQKATDIKSYTDQLIAGAKSTIPSLRFTDDKLGQSGDFSTREMLGFYNHSRNLKVFLDQRIYLKDSDSYVVTASYTPESASTDEIKKVMDGIFTDVVSGF
jgi:hypothetical protein